MNKDKLNEIEEADLKEFNSLFDKWIKVIKSKRNRLKVIEE